MCLPCSQWVLIAFLGLVPVFECLCKQNQQHSVSPYDMQVYVSVYADGPTRVLRFADEKSTALLEAEQSILDLAARLKQVCSWLHHKMVDCLSASRQHKLAARYLPCSTWAVLCWTDVTILTALAL